MRRIFAAVLGAVIWASVAAATNEAQAPLHDSQYPDADIAYGATLYASKCVTCHGTQGDAIGGVNLRSGTFRNAVIDRDLERFIRQVRRRACPRSRWTAARWPASSPTCAT
jgi:mono/diheme cytochrome c family protein